jgi:ABC-type phosphate transport system ATPase subunit
MTDDGAKEWVTVKVPREDKEKADEYRPDGSTFGDCLVAGAERLNDHLDSDPPVGADYPDPEEYAREVVDAVAAEADGQGRVDSDDLADAVARRLDYAELANRVADELEGRMR